MLSRKYGEGRIKTLTPTKIRRYDQIEEVLEKLIFDMEFRNRYRQAKGTGDCIDYLLYHLRQIMSDFHQDMMSDFLMNEGIIFPPLKREENEELQALEKRKIDKEKKEKTIGKIKNKISKKFAEEMNKVFSFPWMEKLIDSGLSENDSAFEIAKCFLPDTCPDDTPLFDRISYKRDTMFRPTETDLKAKADSIRKAYKRYKDEQDQPF